MLSKNNFDEKLRQMDNQKERFSIRKLTIGAASVLIGITFMGFSGQKVSADEVTNTQPATVQVAKTDPTQQTSSDNNEQKDDAVTTQKAETTQAAAQTNVKTDESKDTSKTLAAAEDSKAVAKTVVNENGAKAATDTQTKQVPAKPATTTTQDKNEQAKLDTKKNVEKTPVINEATEKVQTPAKTESKYNVNDWDGTLDTATHEYTLNNYHGTDTENIYIPNTQDFIDAGKISNDDKVYLDKGMIQSIVRNDNARNIVIDDQGKNNKVYAKGDWSYGFSGNFGHGTQLKSVDLTGLDTANVTNMSYMFSNDSNLTTIIGLENWDTSKVTNMSHMFASYNGHNFGDKDDTGNLSSLDLTNWDTHNVTDMSYMFTGQSHLTKIGDLTHRGNKWDTSKVTNMIAMFYGLKSLPDNEFNLSGWDTSNVTDMSYMFYDMRLQKNMNFIDNWNTSKVTDMSYMFYNDAALQSLDLSNWDVSSVGLKNDNQNYSFAAMFGNNLSLTSVGNLSKWGDKTRNVHDTRYMFYHTPKLSNIDLSGWNTNKLQIAQGMFEYSGAKNINLDGWDFSHIKRFDPSGLVNDQGALSGVGDMFAYLRNKAVISMNNITLPDNSNAFAIDSFIGDTYELPARQGYNIYNAQPIVVIANGKNGAALAQLLDLNNVSWKDDHGDNVIGRQNTNKLTYVRADDNTKQIGQQNLNFVFTNVNDLYSYLNGINNKDAVKKNIGKISRDWDAKQDTDNDVVKDALRLYPTDKNDLAGLMTSKYQLHIVAPITTKETSTPTRTIIIENPDGTTRSRAQVVEFTRNVTKYGDGSQEETAWTPASGNWAQFDVPQISGYDSYVDGTAGNVVNAETVAPKAENVVVRITYVSNTPNNPTPVTPDNPTPTPENPSTPTSGNETVTPQPETQPTAPTENNSDNNDEQTVRPHAQNEPVVNKKSSKQVNKNNKKNNTRTVAPHAAVVPAAKNEQRANTTKGMKKLAAKTTPVATKSAAKTSAKAKTLPQTGEKKDNLGLLGLGLLALVGVVFGGRKRRD